MNLVLVWGAVAVALLGCVSGQSTTSSGGPGADDRTTQKLIQLTYPTPSPTTSFDVIVISFDEGCANYCDSKIQHIDSEFSDCTCDDSCKDGLDKYGTCCDYLAVCLNPNTTEAIIETTTTMAASTADATVPVVTSAATTVACPASCGIAGNSCDELIEASWEGSFDSWFTCDYLEDQAACTCNGCLCPVPPSTPKPETTKQISTAETPTTTTTTITVPKTTTTETTTTTPPQTTSGPCKSSCFGLSCDELVPFAGTKFNTRCTYLEKELGCNCEGCFCDDTDYITDAPYTGNTAVESTVAPTTTTTTSSDLNYGIDTAVIGGGYSNTAIGKYSSIGGGRGNADTQSYDVTVGGISNSIRSNYASVGGGYQNTVLGRFSSVPGGRSNSVAGRHSVLLGSQAATAGKLVDHVLLMNFQNDDILSEAVVTKEKTISLQAKSIMFNDVDVVASLGASRQLAERGAEIDLAIERIDDLKASLTEKLRVLREMMA